jgi:hypothetical protein
MKDVAEYACLVGLGEIVQGIGPLLSSLLYNIGPIKFHLFRRFLDCQCIFIACTFSKVVAVHLLRPFLVSKPTILISVLLACLLKCVGDPFDAATVLAPGIHVGLVGFY